ncbi:MAG: DUF1553 domain-containing protein [Gemmataceae bacterium]|nr:DUF1553 domain-containing protein [Gemmataceae bacterium]
MIPSWFLGACSFLALHAETDPHLEQYQKVIQPLLRERCFACHGALKQKSSLRLDTVALMIKGGSGGPIVLPGNPGASAILARLKSTDENERMPPEGEPVSSKQLQALEKWIAAGAPAPANQKPEPSPADHWAFKSPVKADPGAPGNPIDAFLSKAWNEKGLQPQNPASKTLLLRRVFLDLTGLPPQEEDYRAFNADQSHDAYEKTVDRLLASPQYGERWARHWMDIWRYTDWWGLGAEMRNSQKHIWHWRDWIIESLNAGVGYDEMLRLMLAADELHPSNPEKLRATGFLARQYFKFNRNSWMEETVEHTSKAFLGMTFNCARCHDHKYDPTVQVDYYRFRAFFEPYQIRTDMVSGEGDFEKDGIPRVFDCNLDTPTYLFARGDEKNPVKAKKITPGVPDFLSRGFVEIRPVDLPREAYEPELNPLVKENASRAIKEKVGQKEKELAALEKPEAAGKTTAKEVREKKIQAARKSLEAAGLELKNVEARWLAIRLKALGGEKEKVEAQALAAARGEKEVSAALAEAALLNAEVEHLQAPMDKKAPAKTKMDAAAKALDAARKAVEKPGTTFTPLRASLKTLESNLESEASRGKPFPKTSSGRRTALANWVASKENPLTARVAVNHIWLRHMGSPLVETVFDFGRKGTAPKHPELLDWLAADFMQNQWNMKKLHRLILTSRAYSMSSSTVAREKNLANDPDNRNFWRMNSRRLEAQAVRDSLLHLGGKLDLTLGGPSVPAAAQETSPRRALYFFQSHNDHDRFLSQFDDANVLECYRREESTLPQHALALFNSSQAWLAAEAINTRLQKGLEKASDGVFVSRLFLLILGAPPSEVEKTACLEALAAWRLQSSAKAPTQDRLLLIHALLNHNDFIMLR